MGTANQQARRKASGEIAPDPTRAKNEEQRGKEFPAHITLKGCANRPVRFVAIPTRQGVDGRPKHSLVADEAGVYYSVEWRSAKDAGGSEPLSIVRQLTVGAALQWLLNHYVPIAALQRAVEKLVA